MERVKKAKCISAGDLIKTSESDESYLHVYATYTTNWKGNISLHFSCLRTSLDGTYTSIEVKRYTPEDEIILVRDKSEKMPWIE